MRRESTPTLFLLLLVLVRPAVGFFIQLQPSPSIVDRSTLLTFRGDDGENWGGRTSSSNSRRRRGALCSRTRKFHLSSFIYDVALILLHYDTHIFSDLSTLAPFVK
mmetsp:Transcript_18307/g.36890  ORF Transcript_18307/g.36890 Transcript_18307/m.36890 type:complete len:106 (+) Transcript_18307:63-380(+)